MMSPRSRHVQNMSAHTPIAENTEHEVTPRFSSTSLFTQTV